MPAEFGGATAVVSDYADIRDSWETMLKLVAPMTPLLNAIRTGEKPRAREHRWTTEQIKADGYPTPPVEGLVIAEANITNFTPDVYQNSCQEFYRAGSLSRRSQNIDTASKMKEMRKQVALQMKYHMQEMEKVVFGRQATAAASGNVGTRMGAINNYLNVSNGNVVSNTGGAGGAGSATGASAITNGTAYVAFSKETLNSVLQTIKNQGVDSNTRLCMALSTGGRATVAQELFDTNYLRQDVNLNMPTEYVQSYHSELGFKIELKDSANIESLPTVSNDANAFDVLLLDMKQIRKHYLQRTTMKDLANRGFADNFTIYTDMTVSTGNPLNHGALRGRT